MKIIQNWSCSRNISVPTTVGRGTGKTKARKLLGQDKDSLIIKEKVKKPPGQVMQRQSLTQVPQGDQAQPVPRKSLPSVFLAEHKGMRCGIPLWPAGVRCPGWVLLPAPCTTPACSLGAWTLCKCCSATAKTLGASPALFQPQTQSTAPCGLIRRESTPSQPEPVQWQKAPFCCQRAICVAMWPARPWRWGPASSCFSAGHEGWPEGDSFLYAFRLLPTITFPGLFSTTVWPASIINENWTVTLSKLPTQEDRFWATQKFPLVVSSGLLYLPRTLYT